MSAKRSIYRLFAAALFLVAGALLLASNLLVAQDEGGDAARRTAVVLEVDGAIGPATGDFIVRGITDAEESGAALVVLRLNTPGGLDASMRAIISKILASRVPVATYVSPSGSRAASAGTYIMYASHIAAMAPATNLGSATPVSISPGGLGGGREEDGEGRKQRDRDDEAAKDEETDGEKDADASDEAPRPGSAMERKVVNDAVAYIKGLARLRGRNEEWAEQAVRSAVNLTAEDALEQNVIDVVARDVDDLLAQVDGTTISVGDEEMVLATDGLTVVTVAPDWRTRLLAVITNPNVAYILMLVGIYGLFFELSNPGALFPGVLGAICLLLAFYAFQVLPVNYAGVALILLGLAFMVGELFMPSFGVVGIGGVIAFVIGSLILIETDVEAYQLSTPLIVTVAAVTVLFVFTVIAMAVRQRKQPVVSGREHMIGSTGEALADFENGDGTILVHGERWSARCEHPVARGQKVKVLELEGPVLTVEPVPEPVEVSS
ncbi:MAG: nodulation protein NfeD [Gammaproteobacteria bacterium]|nr:nodulation protein NfeD [Gammaproteobacteria bacterium]